MKIRLFTVGKLKEKYLVDAAREYEKRLSRFCNLENIEINDMKIPEKASKSTCDKLLEKEGNEILKRLKEGLTVALCIEGDMVSSEDMAKLLKKAENLSGGINFIIGGSLGLSDEVKNTAQLKISMSRMTFPHQLARIILLEQIYRGFKINGNESYHK